MTITSDQQHIQANVSESNYTVGSKFEAVTKKRQVVENALSEEPATKKQQAPPNVTNTDITSVLSGIKVGARRTSFGRITIGESLRKANAVAANKRNQELASQYEQLNTKGKELTATNSDNSFVSKEKTNVYDSSHSTPRTDSASSTNITPMCPPSDGKNTTALTLIDDLPAKFDLQTASTSPPASPASTSKSTRNVSFNIAANVIIEAKANNIMSTGSRSLSPASPGQAFIDLTLFDDPNSFLTTDPAFIDLTLPVDISTTTSSQHDMTDLNSVTESTMHSSVLSSPPPISLLSDPPTKPATLLLTSRSNRQETSSSQAPKPLILKSPRIFIESLATTNIKKKESPATRFKIESYLPESFPESSTEKQSREYIPAQSPEELRTAEATTSDSSNQELTAITPLTKISQKDHNTKTPRRRRKRNTVSFLPSPRAQKRGKLQPLRSREGEPASVEYNFPNTSLHEESAESKETTQIRYPPAPDYRLMFSVGPIINYSENSTNILDEYNRRLRANQLAAETRMHRLMNMSPNEKASANLKEQEEIAALKRQLNIV